MTEPEASAGGATWDDEDASILWQATARGDALMRDLARGRDIRADVEALLGYLREVVLMRIADEDRHALPVLRRAHPDAPELAALQRQHLQLGRLHQSGQPQGCRSALPARQWKYRKH